MALDFTGLATMTPERRREEAGDILRILSPYVESMEPQEAVFIEN